MEEQSHRRTELQDGWSSVALWLCPSSLPSYTSSNRAVKCRKTGGSAMIRRPRSSWRR